MSQCRYISPCSSKMLMFPARRMLPETSVACAHAGKKHIWNKPCLRRSRTIHIWCQQYFRDFGPPSLPLPCGRHKWMVPLSIPWLSRPFATFLRNSLCFATIASFSAGSVICREHTRRHLSLLLPQCTHIVCMELMLQYAIVSSSMSEVHSAIYNWETYCFIMIIWLHLFLTNRFVRTVTTRTPAWGGWQGGSICFISFTILNKRGNSISDRPRKVILSQY